MQSGSGSLRGSGYIRTGTTNTPGRRTVSASRLDQLARPKQLCVAPIFQNIPLSASMPMSTAASGTYSKSMLTLNVNPTTTTTTTTFSTATITKKHRGVKKHAIGAFGGSRTAPSTPTKPNGGSANSWHRTTVVKNAGNVGGEKNAGKIRHQRAVTSGHGLACAKSNDDVTSGLRPCLIFNFRFGS